MKLEVISFEVKTVRANARRNAGSKYVVLTCESDCDDEDHVINVFDKAAEKYLALIGTDKGGNAAATQPIEQWPEKRRFLSNVFKETFYFPEPMVRLDENGQPAMTERGGFIMRESVEVHTWYNNDPSRTQLRDKNGNPLSAMYPKAGWDLASRGTSVMTAFYAPLTEAPSAAPTPEQVMNGQGAPTPAGVPAA